MSTSTAVTTGLVAAVLLRQVFILAATARSARFLTSSATPAAAAPGRGPVFFIVIPVLREAGIVADTVHHLATLTRGHTGPIVVVTTAREAAETRQRQDGEDTVKVVEQLAATGDVLHLHHDDPDGLKGDQLNLAAAHCAALLPDGSSAAQAFLVCYDVDSRPPVDTLDQFTRAIAAAPEVSVFHQSSRFELRTAPPRRGFSSWLVGAVGEGAALRANRFVTGFEIPRLRNRSTTTGPLKRALCSYVYAHVTTHGLCVRLSVLLELPLPARSPMEDMHYSFLLGSRNLPMLAVPSLDVAEVPDTPRGQVRQAARWFFGPARALRYLRDGATQPGWRARLQAASALGSALEWLGCAIISPAAVAVLVFGGAARPAVVVLVAVYAAQLVVTDQVLGASSTIGRRLTRLVACPAATILFGVGGLVGAARLLRGNSGIGKTERRQAA